VLGNLLDGVANTVATASLGAGSSLTSRSLVTLEALASTTLTVANTLVGALHVVMSSVGQHIAGRVHHIGELLRGSVRVHLAVHYNIDGGASQRSRGRIQITLGGINVGHAELTDTLRAVIGHPVAVA
jgi:hypothetical protein